MKKKTLKMIGDLVGDVIELSQKVRAIELRLGFTFPIESLAAQRGFSETMTLADLGFGGTPTLTPNISQSPNAYGVSLDNATTYTLPDCPPAERTVTDRYGQVWLVTSRGESVPLPSGLRGELVLPILEAVDPDPITGADPERTWPVLLAGRGPLQLVPLTPAEIDDEYLYGPRGARWGNPHEPCPYGIPCALGAGHAGPHRDIRDDPIGMTAPSGRTTDGAVTAEDLATVCTCGRPDQHQPGCPRYARVAGGGLYGANWIENINPETEKS